MSVQATSWVWEHSKAEGNARLVLLAIADGANKQGRRSCQSSATIGEMCRISPRTVRRHIADLVDAGEIQVDGKDGLYQTNVYSFPLLEKPLGHFDLRTDCPTDTGDQSLGQNEGVVRTELCPPTPLPQEPKGSTQGGSAPNGASSGQRLPEGWQPAPETVAQMRQEKPGVDLEAEHRKFTDYWAGIPGAKGRKADWEATWRNWIRRARPEPGEYKPGWQKRLEANAVENQKYRSPSADGDLFAIGR